MLVEKTRPAARQKQAGTGGVVPSLAFGELIVKRVRVERSSCKGAQGIEGIVLDETLNTFVLGTPRGRKRIPKKGAVFLFEGERVSGSLLLHRPEDRTKKLARLFGKIV